MKRYLLTLVLVLGLTEPAAADLAAGFESFERGDYVAAQREFQPLAESGDPRAQYALGIMYLNGYLDPTSPDAAVKWLRSSAERGYIQAQTELARMYRTGDGVPQDLTEMVIWYESAAGQGDVGAQLFLADSYAYGHGVKPDVVRAYMWYEIAIEYWGSLAVDARDVIAEKMSPDQIEEATQLADKWLRENNY
jgi:TPR repeat protein